MGNVLVLVVEPNRGHRTPKTGDIIVDHLGNRILTSASNLTVGAGMTLDVAAGTLVLAANQVSWGSVNKTGSNISDLASLVVSAGKTLDVSAATLTLAAGQVPWSAVNKALSSINDLASLALSAGKTLDVSVATMTFAADQVSWASVNKTGSSLANLAARAATSLEMSATDRLVGRSAVGPGAAEEIACTAFGRTLLAGAQQAAIADATDSSAVVVSGAGTPSVTHATVDAGLVYDQVALNNNFATLSAELNALRTTVLSVQQSVNGWLAAARIQGLISA